MTKQKKCSLSYQLGSLKFSAPSTRNVYSSSTATSKKHKLKKPQGEVHPLIASRTLGLVVQTISGKDYLRRDFQKQLPILLQVQDEKSQSQIGLWASWCNKQQADAFRCDVTKILDYLTFLFEKSYEYRTIGCHRSAISVFYDFLDGKPVGHHPDVCAPVRGVFSSKPLQPIKLLVWTVESVINYVKTKWKNNENLSQKYLTLSL